MLKCSSQACFRLGAYKKENDFSSIAGKISSAKVFAQECSKAFCSLAVSPFVQSVKDISQRRKFV